MKNNIEKYLNKTVKFNGMIGKVFDCTDRNNVIHIETENDFYSIDASEVEIIENLTKSEKAVKEVLAKLNIKIPTIKIIADSEMESLGDSKKTLGFYYRECITLKETKYDEDTVIHEIGHYIHETYLNDRMIKFDIAGKSKYANVNYMENFAECFVQWVNGSNRPYKRIAQMEKILKGLSIVR